MGVFTFTIGGGINKKSCINITYEQLVRPFKFKLIFNNLLTLFRPLAVYFIFLTTN